MRHLVVVVALAAVLATAGCGGTTVGQATPVAVTSIPSSSPPSTAGLPVNQACSLLSAADYRQLGASSPPTQEMIGTAHACEFDSDEFVMAIAIRTNVGLAGFLPVNGVPVHDTTIGRHQAREEKSDSLDCDIAIGVSASSRVDVGATAEESADPCPVALTLARMVERRLP